MTALAAYDRARSALAEAIRIDQVLPLLDEVEHVKLYAKQINDQALLADALAFQLRAEHRLGFIIAEAKKAGHFAEGRPRKPKNGSAEEPFSAPVTLADVGVDKKLSARSQKLASISEQALEQVIIARRQRLASGHALVVDADTINGARSIMGSRQEPDDSLDYFPTPPYATRALLQRVLFPVLGVTEIRNVWEPACGKGHIAGVLQQYDIHVYATDIADYQTKYQDRLCDFLDPSDYAPSVKPGRYDWIITNPPFGDKAIDFVLRALDMAHVGVSMFFRSQWAVEGIERYNRLFRDRPPTLCAFFVERVNLRKGRYDQKGSTATAYCWLTWLQGPENPRAPLWIPPGCRKELTREDDAEVFGDFEPTEPTDAAGNPLTHNNDGEVVVPFRLEQRMEGR